MKFCTALLAFTTLPALLLAQNTPKVPGTLAAPAAPPAATAVPTDPDKVVLSVGNMSLTVAQYNRLVDALPANVQVMARDSKRQFAEQLVQLDVLAQQAENLKLDKKPGVQEQIEFQRKNMLARAAFEDMQQNAKIDDAQIKAYYDAHQNDFESVKAKHILIRVKGAPMPAAPGKPELEDAQALAKAQEIRKKLVAGGDFAALAKAESDDSVSGAQGGDLGEFHKGMMVPPFEQAAFALKIGEVSEPVKSPFGYHIIVVQEHKIKPLSEVKPEIERALRPDVAKRSVDELRAKANVKIDDAFFGPAPSPAGPAPVR